MKKKFIILSICSVTLILLCVIFIKYRIDTNRALNKGIIYRENVKLEDYFTQDEIKKIKYNEKIWDCIDNSTPLEKCIKEIYPNEELYKYGMFGNYNDKEYINGMSRTKNDVIKHFIKNNININFIRSVKDADSAYYTILRSETAFLVVFF